ncbi:MAG: hydrogenase iron-sulfur subunit [Clostridiales bacterium]|jgi:Pyruvate/2-oxoacid:ferredoxin oxidoreductase delta subunit/coenzyme F420-reducing hydrogenase delta subunit|nr:hydrogenase iron-sulfur subunit [Clostridiales bacterium]
MKTVLAGNSTYLAGVADLFEKEGFEIKLASSPYEARALVDEHPVVLVSRSEVSPFITDSQYAWRLIRKVNPLETIVMLLNKDSDSNPYLWKLVLERAIEIASGKRHVCVLCKSVGSRMPGLESLYHEARDLGVSFLKYRSVSLSDEGYTSTITIDDGTDTYNITSPLIIDCTCSPDESVLDYADALRLRTHDNGKINSNRWFLLQGHTSRRNVFYIDTGLMLSLSLEEIVNSIANEIRSTAVITDNTVEIDAKKCAFCYTCYRVCPHGALAPNHDAHAMGVLKSNCSGCGICVAVCPANAIVIGSASHTAHSRSSTEISEEVPDSLEALQTVAFCCENSAAIAARTFAGETNASIVSIPCGGNIDVAQVFQSLNNYKQVIIAVCPDNACKHFDGNSRARLQVERIKKALLAVNKDPDRIKFVQLSHSMPYPLRDALN